MKTNHNLIQICLVGALLLPAVVQAQFSYTINNGTATITGYTGSDGTGVIPDTTNGYPVTAIADYAFYGNSTLTNLTIPSSITNIGMLEFQVCYNLTNVTVDVANPNYASAGGVLFDKAMTTVLQCPGGLAGSYTIPSGVTSIGANAFQYCGQLTGVTIPNTVNRIGGWAFYNTGLTSAMIPAGVTNIGYLAFAGYAGPLASINVDGANPDYASAGGVLFNKALTTLVQYPHNLPGSYTIPGSVTNIGDGAFIYSSLSSVTIPNSVTSIGYSSFWNDNNLTTVAIPDSVVSLAEYAFYACNGLESVTLGSGVASLGYQAFGGCSVLTNFTVVAANLNYASAGGVLFDKAMTTLLQCPAGLASYAMPDGVTNIADNAFNSCYNLTNVTIASSVASIGESAFYYCSGLTSVTIPDSVGIINSYAFGICYNLTNVTFGSGVTNICDGAFYDCSSLLNVTIPNSVTTIGDNPFQYCSSLTNLVLGSGVTSIGPWAFQNCSALTTVTIPASVTSIGSYCFQDCTSLTQADFQGDAPLVDGWEAGSADSSVFSGETGTVYYVALTAGWDTTFGGWLTATLNNPAADFTYVTNNGAVTITGYVGAGGNVTIPDTLNGYPVTSIGANAFLNVSGMTNVVFGSGVTSIGDHAFDSCSGLTSVTIPASVTNLGTFAFENCVNLSQAFFQGNAPWVDGGAGSVDSTVFGGESGTAYYLTGMNGWGATYGGWPTASSGYNPAADFTFYTNVNAITITGYTGTNSNISIPAAITGYPVMAIDDYAFEECYTLKSVTIPGSVTSIGHAPFYDCYNLTNIAVNAANPNYASAGGVLFDKTMTTLIECPGGMAGSYAIPGSVTVIGDSAFGDCYYLTSVTMGNNVTSIGNWAFFSSGLSSLAIGSGVSTIGDAAFYECVNLTSLTIPNHVTSIGSETFDSCYNLTNVVIGSGVTDIGTYAFAYCLSLHQAYFQGNAPTVDGGAGSLDNTVFYGETQLYSGGTGTAYVAPDTAGWGGTFGGWPVAIWSTPATDFTYVTNGAAITITGYIGTNGNVVIPDLINGYPVTSIADTACYQNRHLSRVTIGNNITNIGWMAFGYCSVLTNVTAGAANPNYASADGVLFDKAMKTVVVCPAGLAGSYAIPNTVTNIGVGAFITCSSLTNVTIPHSVTSIGEDAFTFCSSLTSAMIPSSVTSIGLVPFYSCGSLTNITVAGANTNYASVGGVLFDRALTSLIQYPAGMSGSYAMPNSVINLGVGAFAGSAGLTNVTIGNQVTSISVGAFSSCSGLISITIPDSATSIGLEALDECSSLASVTIGNGVTNIDTYAFINCTSLTNVLFGNHVISIGNLAFCQCYSLASVTIPNSVTSIGNAVFEGCSGLTSVTIGGGVTNIGTYAFAGCPNLYQAYFLGNAPSVNGGAGSADTSVFSGEAGTVYYASDTSGWHATFGGWPTAAGSYQSKPQILSSGGGLGVQNNKFQFTFSWAINTAVVVEASTNLQSWTPVSTNTLVNGTSAFTDSTWTNYPRRFYRVRSQ
jgi:hypothetical protein